MSILPLALPVQQHTSFCQCGLLRAAHSALCLHVLPPLQWREALSCFTDCSVSAGRHRRSPGATTALILSARAQASSQTWAQ